MASETSEGFKELKSNLKLLLRVLRLHQQHLTNLNTCKVGRRLQQVGHPLWQSHSEKNDLEKHISDEFLLASPLYAVSSGYRSLSISISAVNWSSLNDDAALKRMIDCLGTTICLHHEIVSSAIECALFWFIQRFVDIYIYISTIGTRFLFLYNQREAVKLSPGR